MLGNADENCYIEAPFYANRGRKHVRLGKNAYINFFFTAVDDTHFYIGDHTMIAPGVMVAVPIRTRSNAQKTHTCFVKAAYNMSCIISPLFLVFAHFFCTFELMHKGTDA